MGDLKVCSLGTMVDGGEKACPPLGKKGSIWTLQIWLLCSKYRMPEKPWIHYNQQKTRPSFGPLHRVGHLVPLLQVPRPWATVDQYFRAQVKPGHPIEQCTWSLSKVPQTISHGDDTSSPMYNKSMYRARTKSDERAHHPRVCFGHIPPLYNKFPDTTGPREP